MTATNYDETSPEPIRFDQLGSRPGFRLVVVGSNGGIGSALCSRALAAGSAVIGLDREAAITERPLPPEITSIPVDVLEPASVKRAMAFVASRWDKIDGLVYVTGVGERPKPTLDHTIEQWDRTHDVNLRGAFLLVQAAVPLMRPFTASMVFVSSGLAVNVEAGFAAYSSSKAGLLAFAKVLAKELAPSIRVNAVAPGLVDTPFLSGGTGQGSNAHPSLEEWFGGPDRARAMREAIPLKRVAEPDDIVAPILFLLGSGARFITGQTLHVNGGRYLP